MKFRMLGAKCMRKVNYSVEKKFHNVLLLVIVCVLTLIISPSMNGQATGSFSGNVLDKSGSAIPGATILVTSQGTGMTREGKADSVGHYLIPLLPVGTYTLHVDAASFQSAESKGLYLQVDEARELDFTLVPASVVTTVAVTGDAVAVETANPSLGQVITSQEVADLPLNGRDFVQLATLTAGATAETNPNSFFTAGSDSEVAARGSFSLSVGGSRPNSTDWLLDGVDNNELTAGGIGIFSSIDDIQEFKVLTYTYSAEYGSRAGPTVLVSTKSGTNRHSRISLRVCAQYRSRRQELLCHLRGKVQPEPVWRLRRRSHSQEQDLLLHRWRTKISAPRHLPSRVWFLRWPCAPAISPPTPSAILFPVSQIVNPNMIGASTDPTVYPNVYFQCDGSGNPLPAAADGSQAQGTACNKIPRSRPDRQHWQGA